MQSYCVEKNIGKQYKMVKGYFELPAKLAIKLINLDKYVSATYMVSEPRAGL